MTRPVAGDDAMDDDDTTASYGLVMPLVACVDQGGIYDGQPFVAGMYVGEIDAKLKALAGSHAEIGYMLYPGLIKQCDLLAMQYGWRMIVKDTGQPISVDENEGNWQEVLFRFGGPRHDEEYDYVATDRNYCSTHDSVCDGTDWCSGLMPRDDCRIHQMFYERRK